MKKPHKPFGVKTVSAPVWKQHITWMSIMKEGALTGVNIKRHKDSLSVKK